MIKCHLYKRNVIPVYGLGGLLKNILSKTAPSNYSTVWRIQYIQLVASGDHTVKLAVMVISVCNKSSLAQRGYEPPLITMRTLTQYLPGERKSPLIGSRALITGMEDISTDNKLHIYPLLRDSHQLREVDQARLARTNTAKATTGNWNTQTSPKSAQVTMINGRH